MKHISAEKGFPEVRKYIENNCGLKGVNIRRTMNGSGNTFNVFTDTGRYIAKLRERKDFLETYQLAQPVLEKAGLRQSHVIYSDDALTLYEWLDGENSKTLTPERKESAFLYLKRYFEALKQIPAGSVKLLEMNNWDKARSLGYLLDEFPENYLYSTVPSMAAAAGRLSENRRILENLPIQLIHSDLGADNFLFLENEVSAVIDFTPETAPEIYGLCQFLYWNVLWQEEDPQLLQKWADAYSEWLDHEVFDLLMIQTALFRVSGPLLNGDIHLDKRIKLLESLL